MWEIQKATQPLSIAVYGASLIKTNSLRAQTTGKTISSALAKCLLNLERFAYGHWKILRSFPNPSTNTAE